MSSKLLKLAFIAPASVVHTVKWVNGLINYGFEVHLITQHKLQEPISESVIVHQLPFKGGKGYVLNALHLNRLIKSISPDIINVHYASGYGTLANLAQIPSYVLSIWGSDVYEFPYKSWFHKWLIKANLKSAAKLASTSHAMAEQVRKIFPDASDIAITPFGVNLEQFSPIHKVFTQEHITIGVVKRMEEKYGLDVLINAFNLTRQTLIEQQSDYAEKLRLLIVGDGALTNQLKEQVVRLNLSEVCQITGAVPHAQVNHYINQIDLFVVSSRIESFGVSVVEAAACERACIVSNIGGLPEVVVDKKTGFIVESESPKAFSKALLNMIEQQELARTMGANARQFALSNYSEHLTMDIMVNMLNANLELH
ncbi:glycosyltransferase [Thalassotalea piscium]|uniref:Glycosyltransferase involved in cell wall biosynthesis n=1 Tax=Thalassotalea piscium TaxID=1230533 RepID=A0A7X0NFY5_9GAMM|nr:glycosyltransferase [Thalassotalea piscium]MBB6542752.1 glycosyltransferase involved in cell wall biosynthesis [Thalassotalea piscium]